MRTAAQRLALLQPDNPEAQTHSLSKGSSEQDFGNGLLSGIKKYRMESFP